MERGIYVRYNIRKNAIIASNQINKNVRQDPSRLSKYTISFGSFIEFSASPSFQLKMNHTVSSTSREHSLCFFYGNYNFTLFYSYISHSHSSLLTTARKKTSRPRLVYSHLKFLRVHMVFMKSINQIITYESECKVFFQLYLSTRSFCFA